MVDEVRVLRLLRSVTDDLAVLRGEASADARRQADALWLRGVKYTFWQGFRNVLVHEYVEVDDSVMLARLTDPSDLDEFVAAVVEWTSSDRWRRAAAHAPADLPPNQRTVTGAELRDGDGDG